jgi:hypothetical protein
VDFTNRFYRGKYDQRHKRVMHFLYDHVQMLESRRNRMFDRSIRILKASECTLTHLNSYF